jgi:hypothetical protein
MVMRKKKTSQRTTKFPAPTTEARRRKRLKRSVAASTIAKRTAPAGFGSPTGYEPLLRCPNSNAPSSF